jgi:hypothetical protein
VRLGRLQLHLAMVARILPLKHAARRDSGMLRPGFVLLAGALFASCSRRRGQAKGTLLTYRVAARSVRTGEVLFTVAASGQGAR